MTQYYEIEYTLFSIRHFRRFFLFLTNILEDIILNFKMVECKSKGT